MKRYLPLFLCLALALSGCAGKDAMPVFAPASEPETTVLPATQSELAAPGKILIAYFTWADNTQVDDPASVDPDASTSASVLRPGNAAILAGYIADTTGGDLFSIQVEDPYPSGYDACLDRAAEEKAANARPALVSHVENMEEYGVVFLGFPNWWYTIPMAVYSFVEEYDLSGKTVVPFVTHGTGGLAGTARDLTAALPDCQVLEPIGVYRQDAAGARMSIHAWLASLGFACP